MDVGKSQKKKKSGKQWKSRVRSELEGKWEVGAGRSRRGRRRGGCVTAGRGFDGGGGGATRGRIIM